MTTVLMHQLQVVHAGVRVEVTTGTGWMMESRHAVALHVAALGAT